MVQAQLKAPDHVKRGRRAKELIGSLNGKGNENVAKQKVKREIRQKVRVTSGTKIIYIVSQTSVRLF